MGTAGQITIPGGAALQILPTAQGAFTFNNALVLGGTGTIGLRCNNNDSEYTFSGPITSSATGPQTLALQTGYNGNGDRESMIFNSAIPDGAGGNPLSLGVTYRSQSGAADYVSLNSGGTFTGSIALSIYNGGTTGYLVIGGTRTRLTNTVGTGTLGGGSYAGGITLASGTILEYDSTSPQTLSGVISGAGAVTVTGSGVLTLSAANTYSGNTTVNSGATLTLTPASSLNFVVKDASANKVTGAGTANFNNGVFTIDTSAVTAFVGSWTLVDVTTKTYGGGFGVTGFTGPVGTVFTKTDGIRIWTFDTATGVLSVTAKALITSFGLTGYPGIIDQNAKTIALTVPHGTDLATLAPTFTTSSGTCDQTSGSPPSPTFAGGPVTYTVTDSSASVTNPYVVTVTVAPAAPAGVSGLALWLDASASTTMSLAGTTVSEWRNEAGGTAKATLRGGTPTLVASGIGGIPTVHFNSSAWMNDGVNHSAPCTILYVSRQTGGSNQRVLGATGNNWLMGYHGGNQSRFYFNGWVYQGPSSDTNSHLYAATIGGSGQNSTVYAEGAQLAANQGGTQGPNNLQLNGYNSANELSNCDISEVLVYNGVLSSTDLNAVGYYLTTKYKLTTTYINPNPTAPENVHAIAGDAAVSLTWATYVGATSYNVKRSATPGGPYTTVGTPTGTSYTDSSSLVNGLPYYYVVSAVASSESPNSSEVSATPTGVDATLSTVASSRSMLWADGVDSPTITVTLLNSSSTPIAGKSVALAMTSGTGSPVINTVTGTTGADGKAVFTVTSTTPATDVFTATDITDVSLVINQTVTLTFVAAAPLAINLNIDNTVRSNLFGPAGGLGAVWNTVAATSQANLLHASGPVTTVGFSSSGSGGWAGPDFWGNPALDLIKGGLRNFNAGAGNWQTLVINNLTVGKKYDLYIASANCSVSPSNQRSYGVWTMTNATTTAPTAQTCDNRTNVIGDHWVLGNNYVVFKNVQPDASGNITVNGYSIPDAPTYDVRMPLSGFQLVEAVPAYDSWASANAGGQPADQDSNGDGVSNGIAYFMNATGLATLPALDANKKVTWTNGHNIPSTDYGSQFVVQTSSDLQNWTNVSVSDPNLANTADSVSYTIPDGSAKIFCRLAVTPQ